MAVRFFFMAPSKNELSEALKAADYDLDELTRNAPGAPLVYRGWPGNENEEFNNPWLPEERREELSIPSSVPLGYGLAFEGEPGEVAKLFALAPSVAGRPVAGIEFGAGPLDSAPPREHWCAGMGRGSAFATRAQAERLIGASALGSDGLTGKGVRILVVDQGLDGDYIEREDGIYGGPLATFWPNPGPGHERVPLSHGAMVARSLIRLAPDATLYDLPLIPHRISDILEFALNAAFAFFTVGLLLKFHLPGRWIIVNAWGVNNRFNEDEWGRYSGDAEHPLNIMIGELGQQHDVIFAAGNGGLFCPSRRSGPYDRGPGASILGANGHAEVLSVGAVRGDGTWVGASAQGPALLPESGAEGLQGKPDLCAPSWFRENEDRALRSGGTSAACAVAAGAVAALRERWGTSTVPPAMMRHVLRSGARRAAPTGWNSRLGEGILNVPGAIALLPP